MDAVPGFKPTNGITVGSALSDFGSKKAGDVVQAVRVGFATGKTIDDISKSIVELQPMIYRQARALAQTITNHVAAQSRHEFYKDNSEFSDQMKTPLDKEDGTPDINSTEETDIMKGLRGNDRKGNEASSKELADGLTLYLIRSLIEVDDAGKHIMNELGFPKLASFPNTWNSLVELHL